MGKDKKKKGKGMEKTLAKTEKKLEKNFKKELKEIGEDDIETMIAKFNEEQKQLNQVKEEVLPSGQFPSRRGGATFSLYPEREELILFGGEYYDGIKVSMYNNLYMFNIKKSQWSLIQAPNGPPPRTFHQSVFVSRNGGELWVFGGEFSSPSQSQFYHYNDLWLFSFQTKQWNKIVSPNSPSPRSGHRMIQVKKYLVIFGGYYDNLRNCKFYNDTYLFNLETNKWEEMKFSATGLNNAPSPRSACQLCVCNKTNNIVLYGGFSKEKLKKDKEKGVIHSDMFVLSHETKKTGVTEWSWQKVKQTGMKPTDRISFSMVTLHDDSALLFGGVYDNPNDEHDEDEADSVFFNDIYKLDLTTYKWTCLALRGKREIKKKSTKVEGTTSNLEENNGDEEEDDLNESTTEKPDEVCDLEQLKIEEAVTLKEANSAFTLTYETKSTNDDTVVVINKPLNVLNLLLPHPRRSSYLQFHKGSIYLYGGKYEDKDDKEITFNDMFTLNIKKLDEWKLLFEDKDLKLEQLKKAIDSDSLEGEDDDDDSDDDSEMEIDAPKIEPNETIEQYFSRHTEFWMGEAESEFPGESKAVIKKMASELCSMFWKNFQRENAKSQASA